MKNLPKFLRLTKTTSNIYIHIPFCIKKCHFCAFPIHAVGTLTGEDEKKRMYTNYCEKLLKEIEIVQKNSEKPEENYQSIYFGGGTPSLFSPSQIKTILQQFEKNLDDKSEITLEMNPEELGKFESFLESGINRFSVGIQTLNKETLKQFNRESRIGENSSKFEERMKNLSEKANLNVDFIIDFNNEDEDEMQMMRFIEYVKPKHISLYMLEINEGSYVYRNREFFKQKIDKFEKYTKICNDLSQRKGYQQYEISNFCQPGFRSKHNQAYWLGDRAFGAFGMGSTSLLDGCRASRPKNLSKYYEYVQRLEQHEDISEFVQINNEQDWKEKIKWVILSRIRREEGVSWKELEEYLPREMKLSVFSKMQLEADIIHNENSLIIDKACLDKGIILSKPNGFLFADEVSYRLLDCIE